MVQVTSSAVAPLRVFCLEDNPLIVFHLEQLIEDLGHIFAGSLASFADLQDQSLPLAMDCALVDIDLADGPSGPDALAWLVERGVPAVFVTGQQDLAIAHSEFATGVIVKPISEADLAVMLERLAKAQPATVRRK